MAFNTTSHIRVTETPPGFLKQRIVKSHFSQYGTITRLTILKDCIYLSYENPGQAQDAVLNGIEWKGMLMKIDFCPSHHPFDEQDDSKDEIVYFEDEPQTSKKKRQKSVKASLGSRSSDDPPKKIGRIDLTNEDEKRVTRSSSSRTCKKHRERYSSTTKFLEKIKSRSRSPVGDSFSSSSFDTNLSSPTDSIVRLQRDREDSRERSPVQRSIFEKVVSNREDLRGKTRAVKTIFDKFPDARDDPKDKSRPAKSIFEKANIYLEKEDEGKSPLRTSEEDSVESPLVMGTEKSDEKAIMSFFDIKSGDKEMPMVVDDPKPECKFELTTYGDVKTFKGSSPGASDFFKGEVKSAVRVTEVKSKIRDTSPIGGENMKAENKPVQRLIAVKKRGRESPPTTVVEKKVDEKSSIKLSEESKVSLKSNDAPFYAKTASTLKDKLDLLEERDKQIRLLPEVSGMESILQGTCPDMCPEKERILRELRNMVAPYEALPDGRMDHGKAVKEYTRSSADQGKPLPHELRPEPVLTMTMSYLINCIISRIDEVEEENLHNWYDFCWGRLRAIRKDIIQQDLCDKNTVRILEQCARFHIACYDRLLGLSKSLFDDKLNTETLNNCLTSLMKFYKDLRRDKIICPHEAEFNAYFILLNMNNGGFLISEYQKYSSILKQSPLIKEAVRMHLAYHNNMFATYFKLTKNSSYLNSCLAQRFFQHVRTEALNTIIKSHCTPNKLSTISTDFLMAMLKLDSIDDCVNFCESTGLTYFEDEKSFKIYRNDFYISEDIYKVESPSSIIIGKRVPIAVAVTGSEHTLPIYLKHVVHESFTPEGLLKDTAIDASDQEEKMLRDNVERNLLVNRLKTTLVQGKEEEELEEIVSSSVNIDFDVKETLPEHSASGLRESLSNPEIVDTSLIDAFEDRTDSAAVIFEPDEEGMTIQEPTSPKISSFRSFSFKVLETFKTINSVDETSVDQMENLDIPIQESKPTDFLNIEKPIYTNVLKNVSEESQTINFPPISKLVASKTQVSPTAVPKYPVFSFVNNKANLLETALPKETSILQKSDPFVSDDLLKSDETKSFKTSRSKPYASRNSRSTQKSQTKWEKSFSRAPRVEEKLMKKTPPNEKLRKKLSENMKKISARKYFRMWKEKASKLKSLKILEAMVLQDLSTKEYLAMWGKPSIKRSLNLSRHVHLRKKNSVMVHLILHSDIIDKINQNSKNIGNAVINALGEKSIKMADIWGNIAQPNPIFWKLIFALPLPPESGTTFTMKLRSWCKAAFYRGEDKELSSVEIHNSDSGVPVITKICVVEGLEELSSCGNLSALVVIRAHNWESTSETRKRLEKFVSLCNHPIPVAVLNVGSQVESIEIAEDDKNISWFVQRSWENSLTTSDVLRNLARYTHLFNIRIKPFCNLLDCSVEKLFDMIGQDSFFNDNLSISIRNPNNVISIYNSFILKVEEEIKECQVNKFFGTAYEFKNDLERINNAFMFPDNYQDSNFVEALVLRCRKCKLPPLKLDFLQSKELVSFLTNYCDDISCQNILKTLLRYLNLPDEDSGINLPDYLKSVQWLPFIEIILKEIFMSHLLSFKVAYRDDVLNNIFNSHYWLEF